MAHVRKTIRDNITTTLTGLTTTGSNVYQTRFYPLAEAKLAGLCIYTNSESTETSTITVPRTQLRTLEVMVEAYVKGTTNIDLGKGGKDSIVINADSIEGGKLKVTNFTKKDTITVGDETFTYNDIKNGAEIPNVKIKLA